MVRPRRVLITGVSRHLGARLASLVAADPSIERVIGVDTFPPAQDLGRTEFVRADIRNPLIAKVITSAEVDTVVHMNVIATPGGAGGRTAMKEINVIGTMQLLAACQKAPSVRKLVVKSTTAVYGASPRDPARFTEDMGPRAVPRTGYGKDAVEVEGYVRGFGRRRPDVTLTLLRFTNFVGPQIDSLLTTLFQLPIIPTVLGFDPRIQLTHEDDGLAVLAKAIAEEHPGIFNVGGDGVMLLSQAIRRAGKASISVPGPAVNTVANIVKRTGLVDFSPDQVRFLTHGRVVDTTRLREQMGIELQWTTQAAFDDYVEARLVNRLYRPEQLERLEAQAMGILTGLRRLVGV
jgi:UDP-glucose 4-epimerase